MPVFLSSVFFVLAFAATAECVFPMPLATGVLKSLPALYLTGVALAYTRPRFRWWVVAGIVCGAMGDYSLSSAERTWFMAGLGSFLVGHVAYSIAFAKDLRLTAARGVLIVAVLLGMALLVAATCFRVVRQGEAGLALPIIVYVSIMSVMMTIAVLHRSSTWFIAAGAVIFVISDAHIAINYMLLEHSRLGLAISGYATYYAAQYFLVAGAAHETRAALALRRAEMPH